MPIRVGTLILYTVDDIGLMLGVHPGTVRKYLRRNKMKGRKIARKWYVQEEELMRYLRETGTDMVIDPPEAQDFQGMADLDLEEVAALEAIRSMIEAENPDAEVITVEESGAGQAVRHGETVIKVVHIHQHEHTTPPPAPRRPRPVYSRPPRPAVPEEDDNWREELEQMRAEALRLKNQAHSLEEDYVDSDEEE